MNPLKPSKLVAPPIVFPSGAGGFGRGTGLENPFVGIKEYGVDNILFAGLSLDEKGGLKYSNSDLSKMQATLEKGLGLDAVLGGTKRKKGRKKKGSIWEGLI
jgi:hypothetical protein